jgi:hypothetical protein
MKSNLYIKILNILTFSVGFLCFSQNDLKLPEFAVPSPQAYQFTKYGDVPVDESSGRISPTIPIYSFKSGAIELPLNFNYLGNGVKVSEVSGWTGINWTLKSGGVITRVVKDLPDETDKPRYLLSKDEINTHRHLLNVMPGMVMYVLDPEIISMIKDKEDFDSMVDEFNFSLPGYSGTFYLKQDPITGNFTPILSKYDKEIKISIVGNFTNTGNYYFVITTDDGSKYTFGAPNILDEYAIEETQLVDRSGSEPYFGVKAKTSFYLTKIENHLGDIMNFKYDTKESYEVYTPQNQKLEKFLGTADTGICNTGPILPTGLNDLSATSNLSKNIIYNGKFLSEINNNGSKKITFIFTENTTPLNEYSRILTKIDVLNDVKIHLEYTPTVTSSATIVERYFLKKIEIKDSSDSDIGSQKYQFEYNEQNLLPGIQSFSQDYLGYYNGKINPSLLPRNSIKFLNPDEDEILNNELNFDEYDAILADREPDFAMATKGVLTKIKYPTGGHTLFEYEPAEKSKIFKTLNFEIKNNMFSQIPSSKLKEYHSLSDNTLISPDSNEVGQNIFEDQIINAKLEINTLTGEDLDYHDYVYLKVKDLSNGHESIYKYFFPNTVTFFGNTQTNFTTYFTFSLSKNKGYTFELGFGDNYVDDIDFSELSYFTPTGLVANLSFEYCDGLNPNDGLGIRIKRVSDFDNQLSDPTNVKRFYYNKMKDVSDLNSDTKLSKFKPQYHNLNLRTIACTPEFGNYMYEIYNYAILTSNSFDMVYNKFDNQSFYKIVSISYGGDHFENGGVEKYFSYDQNERLHKMYVLEPAFEDDPYLLPHAVFLQYKRYDTSSFNNSSSSNGTLIKENIWKQKNNALFKIKTTTHDYTISSFDEINNIYATTTFDVANLNLLVPSQNFTGCYMGLFKYTSYKTQLSSTTTKEFIEPVPISIYTRTYVQGWQTQDEDGDGINNNTDPDYITPSEYALMTDVDFELPYKKIISTTNFSYSADLCNFPSIITTTNSEGITSSTKIYYPTNYFLGLMTGLIGDELSSYTTLKTQHRISNPIQTESYLNGDLMKTSRTTYKNFDIGKVLINKVKSSKANSPLEDRIIYHSYDSKGNPQEISMENGVRTVYRWSLSRKPIIKFVNATNDQIIGTAIPFDPDSPESGVNLLRIALPKAQITCFYYTAPKDLLQRINDPKGDESFFEYDNFDRLKLVRDKFNNIITENYYNIKP